MKLQEPQEATVLGNEQRDCQRQQLPCLVEDEGRWIRFTIDGRNVWNLKALKRALIKVILQLAAQLCVNTQLKKYFITLKVISTNTF